MIEVNLLNQKGIHKKENSKFEEIDDSFISDVTNNPNHDFEREHKVKKVVIKSKKRRLFIFCFLTLLIIGGSFYYQFFINNKSIVQSEDFKELINHVINEENFQLSDLSLNNYAINLNFKIDAIFYDGDIKENLKKYLDRLTPSEKYNIEISKNKDDNIITIKYPPFLEVSSSKFDKNLILEEHTMNNSANINVDSLKNILNYIFNINNPTIMNFEINKIDRESYNISFSE